MDPNNIIENKEEPDEARQGADSDLIPEETKNISRDSGNVVQKYMDDYLQKLEQIMKAGASAFIHTAAATDVEQTDPNIVHPFTKSKVQVPFAENTSQHTPQLTENQPSEISEDSEDFIPDRWDDFSLDEQNEVALPLCESTNISSANIVQDNISEVSNAFNLSVSLNDNRPSNSEAGSDGVITNDSKESTEQKYQIHPRPEGETCNSMSKSLDALMDLHAKLLNQQKETHTKKPLNSNEQSERSTGNVEKPSAWASRSRVRYVFPVRQNRKVYQNNYTEVITEKIPRIQDKPQEQHNARAIRRSTAFCKKQSRERESQFIPMFPKLEKPEEQHSAKHQYNTSIKQEYSQGAIKRTGDLRAGQPRERNFIAPPRSLRFGHSFIFRRRDNEWKRRDYAEEAREQSFNHVSSGKSRKRFSAERIQNVPGTATRMVNQSQSKGYSNIQFYDSNSPFNEKQQVVNRGRPITKRGFYTTATEKSETQEQCSKIENGQKNLKKKILVEHIAATEDYGAAGVTTGPDHGSAGYQYLPMNVNGPPTRYFQASQFNKFRNRPEREAKNNSEDTKKHHYF